MMFEFESEDTAMNFLAIPDVFEIESEDNTMNFNPIPVVLEFTTGPDVDLSDLYGYGLGPYGLTPYGGA